VVLLISRNPGFVFQLRAGKQARAPEKATRAVESPPPGWSGAGPNPRPSAAKRMIVFLPIAPRHLVAHTQYLLFPFLPSATGARGECDAGGLWRADDSWGHGFPRSSTILEARSRSWPSGGCPHLAGINLRLFAFFSGSFGGEAFFHFPPRSAIRSSAPAV